MSKDLQPRSVVVITTANAATTSYFDLKK